MSEVQCAGCDRPTSGARLCGRCRKTLEVALVNVAAYAADLETVVRTKRGRFGAGSSTKGTRGKTQPMPIDGRFADATGAGTQLAYDLRNTVVTWTRELMEAHKPIPGPVCRACLHVTCADRRRTRVPADTIASMCTYLTGWLSALAGSDDGPLILDEMLDLERRLRTFIDRPLDRIWAGLCTVCRVVGDRIPLYAQVGDIRVECPECGAEYDVASRRDDMKAGLDSMLLTAAEIATLATYLDLLDNRDRVRNRINQWHKRDRLTASATTSSGDPQFVFGDVVRMLVAADSSQRVGVRCGDRVAPTQPALSP